MFAEILEVLGPLRTEGRRISFPIPRCREREREEKKRARLPPPGGGINSRLGRAQKRSTDRGRAARYKGRKLNQGIKIKLGLIKWRGSGGGRRIAELIRRPRESSSLSVIRGRCGHPRAFPTPHRLEKNGEAIDGPSDGRFT